MASLKDSKKKILMIAGLVLLVGGVGFGGFMMGKGKSGPAKEKTTGEEIVADSGGHPEGESKKEGKKEDKKEGKEEGKEGGKTAVSKKDLTFNMEELTVNLLDPSARTYLRTSVNIEAKSAEGLATIQDNEYALRDVTVTLLSGKTREEILTMDGWERLKQELRVRYDGKLGADVISEVYLGSRNIFKN